MHKLITFLFTGKKIKFGNFSCLTKNDVNLISQRQVYGVATLVL